MIVNFNETLMTVITILNGKNFLKQLKNINKVKLKI